MGDRSLVMLKNEKGQKVIAQYGQWGGFPSGIGIDVLRFLRDKNLVDKLKNNLQKVRFLEVEGIDKLFYNDYLAKSPKQINDIDKRSNEQKRWWNTYCNRNLSAKILINIANSTDDEIIIIDREETAKEDGWVECSCIINLEENTFSIFTHIDEQPLKIYRLDNLPTEKEFLRDFDED